MSKAPASSGKKKALKQGNLFSFFSKKPAPAKASVPVANDDDTQPAAAAAVKPKDPPAPAAAAAAAPPLWKQVSVGTRVSIYWPDDDKFYDATVSARRSDPSVSIFTVTYDDGEIEKVDLATDKFRILKTTNKKRKIIEEDSEEEFEFDDEVSESDGSAYKPGEEKEQDDEEEAANWMVTDDEEEQDKKPAASKKAKKKTTLKVTRVDSSKTPAKKKPTPDFSMFKTPKTTSSTNTTPAASTGSTAITPGTTPPPILPSRPTGAALPYVEGVVNPAGSHVHNHLRFLRNPKDSKGRSSDHADYDPRTLRVDYGELEKELGKKLSPGTKQWWSIKSQYADTVLLFKTGKFYEMFHMDADVGVNVLQFTYMKGINAHAGFPEISYGQFADRLVRAGYKVARVEQTETPEMLKERKKKKGRGGPTPQVVNREVCSVMTLGTRTFCYMDDEAGLLENAGVGSAASSIGPLLAIKEVMLETSPSQSAEGEGDASVQPVCEYGIVLVDAVRAGVTVGQFADDVLRGRMNTLLTRFQPSEILVEGGEAGASPTLLSLLRSFQATSGDVRIERVQTSEQFPKSNALDNDVRRQLERKSNVAHPWDVEETLEEIHRRGYYPRASREQEDRFSTTRWPKVLHLCVEGGANLALSSFGAVLFYLQRNLIDQEILGMGVIQAYIPPAASGTFEGPSGGLEQIASQQEDNMDLDLVPPMTPAAPEREQPGAPLETSQEVAEEAEINHLALDGTTLANLEVLANQTTHTSGGSLWSKINYTKTPHGARMLRAWLLRPLFRKADIERRADAVEELTSGGAAVALSDARNSLAKCGDIERLLSRIHSMGGSSTQDDPNPSSRAILYEGAKYTKRKVGDFAKVLNGLRNATQIPEIFEGVDIQSGLLLKVVRSINNGGCFPVITDELDWFFNNFDCDRAAEGLFEPSRGVDESYDEACDTIDRIHRELEDYKVEMCSDVLRAGSRSRWKYINTKPESKDKYLIELPADIQVPDDFFVKGKRGSGHKQVNKYRTPVVGQLVQELEDALAVQKEGKAKGLQLVFAKFDTKRSLWAAAAQCTAILDALGSLSHASSKPGYTRPKILDCPLNASPCVHVVQGRHPCVDITHNGGEFIPNDLTLGSQERDGETAKRVLLLSGPNMGGKSTLLRQTCLIAILAQIGCFVPASECALTPVDRIYTRLGASDRILLGQSTFFVELAETAGALRGATRRSLVIMDELGRGTSTFDGTALASACVASLIENNKCLTLFATHYHSLLKEWMDEPTVRLGHMQCCVEGGVAEDNEEAETEDHNITFLYTLGDGACPKSFGINVAKLAGLPDDVLCNAKQMSIAFESEMNGEGPTRKVTAGNALQIKNRLEEMIQSDNVIELERMWEELKQE